MHLGAFMYTCSTALPWSYAFSESILRSVLHVKHTLSIVISQWITVIQAIENTKIATY